MHLQTILQQLGLKAHEAKLYLASLSFGEATISDLVKKVNLPRTTVTEAINSLRRSGLLNPLIKKNRRLWVAENPDKLMIQLKEKEGALKTVLPVLHGMRYETGGKPSVRIYSGVEEIKLIMEDIIHSKHNILALMSWDDWREFFGREYISDFIERRYAHFLKIKLLSTDTENARRLKEKDLKELRQTRLLSKDVNLRNSNFIYGSKVAIISMNRKEPVGVLIEDADIVNTMTIFFDCLWNQSLNS